MERKNLKLEFIKIGESKKQEMSSPEVLLDLKNEYEKLFLEFSLEDIRFNLTFDVENQTVNFNPARNIDKLAIKGILSL